MMKTNFALKILLLITILFTLTGCGSLLKGLVGTHNVNSVQLAAKCQMPEALAEVKKGENHQSDSNRALSFLLQAMYLQEMNQQDAAKALYPQITQNAVWIKSNAEIDKELKKMRKDLGKLRKRQGMERDCR
jgi:hypothetical protein